MSKIKSANITLARNHFRIFLCDILTYTCDLLRSLKNKDVREEDNFFSMKTKSFTSIYSEMEAVKAMCKLSNYKALDRREKHCFKRQRMLS